MIGLAPGSSPGPDAAHLPDPVPLWASHPSKSKAGIRWGRAWHVSIKPPSRKPPRQLTWILWLVVPQPHTTKSLGILHMHTHTCAHVHMYTQASIHMHTHTCMCMHTPGTSGCFDLHKELEDPSWGKSPVCGMVWPRDGMG